MAPVLEAACRQFTPRARFGKLNTEQAPQASSAYGIRGIPTLVLLERGSERDRVTGAMTAQQLNQWLTQHLRTA
jgi:thioredoxin 2